MSTLTQDVMYILRDSSAAYSYSYESQSSDKCCLHWSSSSWRFLHSVIFHFSACTEYGNSRPITWTVSEWDIFLHVKLSLCRTWCANNGSGAVFKCRGGFKFSIANGNNFFSVNFRVKWNFTQVEHLSFIARCAFFLYQFLRSNEIPLNTNLRFSRTKNVVDCEASG